MSGYRPTLGERLREPFEFAGSVRQSLRRDFTRPHLVEVALAYPRDDRPHKVIVTIGPWWLKVAASALRAADTLTGCWWCNGGPFGGPGLGIREIELLEQYGVEVEFTVTTDEAATYRTAMGWDDLDDEDDEQDEATT